MSSVERVSAFLAQCGHESLDFNVLQENLNYSTDGLLKIFPKYFNSKSAAALARMPEKIANTVYANRMGNGDYVSGDGWRYHGRGAIQLTGKNNYVAFAADLAISLEEAVTYLGTLNGAIESACWFWNKNGLNILADKSDIVGLTKKINGGTIGLDDRKLRFNNCSKALK
jgi:putative chitinase